MSLRLVRSECMTCAPPDGTGVDVALAANRKSGVVMIGLPLSAARHLPLALLLHNFTDP